jgi:glycosyltransferase involved in cell wall biosynthesis
MPTHNQRHVLMLLENNPLQEDARLIQEASGLIKAGYRITVIGPAQSKAKPHEVVEGIRSVEFAPPRDGHGALSYLWEYGYSTFLISVLSLWVWMRDDFHILHLHNPPDTFFWLAKFYKILGKRVVFDHHDLAPEMYSARLKKGQGGSPWIVSALTLCQNLTCRVADLILATNESYKTIDIDRGKVPADRITIVRNGPGVKFRAVAPDLGLRQKAGTLLGYVGVMGPQDGVDHFLRALSHLIFDFKRENVFSVIIGLGSEVPNLKVLVQELQIEQQVWFTGWVSNSDLIRYLSTVDICVDPDPSNPFNDRSTMTKMMEYMALGKPIVAYDLPEHRVTAQEAAVYAIPNDERDFARQISLLMDDPEKQKRMGNLGRERVETQLAWSFQEKHLLEAYETLTLRGKRGYASIDEQT